MRDSGHVLIFLDRPCGAIVTSLDASDDGGEVKTAGTVGLVLGCCVISSCAAQSGASATPIAASRTPTTHEVTFRTVLATGAGSATICATPRTVTPPTQPMLACSTDAKTAYHLGPAFGGGLTDVQLETLAHERH